MCTRERTEAFSPLNYFMILLQLLQRHSACNRHLSHNGSGHSTQENTAAACHCRQISCYVHKFLVFFFFSCFFAKNVPTADLLVRLNYWKADVCFREREREMKNTWNFKLSESFAFLFWAVASFPLNSHYSEWNSIATKYY